MPVTDLKEGPRGVERRRGVGHSADRTSASVSPSLRETENTASEPSDEEIGAVLADPAFAAYLELMEAAAPRHGWSERVITVRMPAALHEQLKARAAAERCSMNWLCLSLLGDWPLHPTPAEVGTAAGDVHREGAKGAKS